VAIGLQNPVSHVNNIYGYLLHCCAKTLVPKRWWNEEIVKLTKGTWVGWLLQMVHDDPPGGFS
jgi:hypothetical protein